MTRTQAILLFLTVGAIARPVRAAPWTYIIYMNARNGMDCLAMRDFGDMASSGSIPGVREIFVEVGLETPFCRQLGSGIYRFHVMPGMAAVPSNAEQVAPDAHTIGMGKTVADFVSWAMAKSPKGPYALIIWGHGTGSVIPYLEMLALTPGNGPTKKILASGVEAFGDGPGPPPLVPLHISDLATKLQEAKVPKLDVLGIEACLMGSFENAYGLRNVAKSLVASEPEIMRGAWSYSSIVLNTLPGDSVDASSRIAEYAQSLIQGFDKTSAFSAINLDRTGDLNQKIAELGKALSADLKRPSSFHSLLRVVRSIKPYGTPPGEDATIDLKCFAAGVRKERRLSRQSRAAASWLYDALNLTADPRFVIATYPTNGRDNGVSIFLPGNKAEWDGFQGKKPDLSYDPADCGKTKFDIEFVCQAQKDWATFVTSFAEKLPVGANRSGLGK